jgi:hypothetical protein
MDISSSNLLNDSEREPEPIDIVKVKMAINQAK